MSDLNLDQLNARAAELMKPVYQQIMMTDEKGDMLLLSLAMLKKAAELLDTHFDKETRIKQFEIFTK
jgi:hypothetical protein